MLDENVLKELANRTKSYEKLKHSASFKEWVSLNDTAYETKTDVKEIKDLLREFISSQTNISIKHDREIKELKKMFEEAKP